MGSRELRTTKRIFILIFFLCIWRCLAAQTPAAGSPDTGPASFGWPSSSIRISTNLVTVPVSVTDATGSSVADLEIVDFQIKEDGRRERISTMIKAGQSPLQLVLIFDLSGSIHSDFEFERAAAHGFLKKVWKPGDTVSIVSVSNRPTVHLRASTLPEEVRNILSGLQPTEDATAFFDAVVMAASLLNESTAPSTRQAVVIFSDGEDNRSDCSFTDVLDILRHSNAVVYSINPSRPSIRLNQISRMGQEWLVSLTGETGGTAFVSNRIMELESIYERIAFELRAQYLLSYYSSNTLTDGSFRNISVTLPEKPDLFVRARQGYYAFKMPTEPEN